MTKQDGVLIILGLTSTIYVNTKKGFPILLKFCSLTATMLMAICNLRAQNCRETQSHHTGLNHGFVTSPAQLAVN